jgi:outer membrane protein
MKKQLGLLLAASSMFCASVTQADILGFEIGAYQWKPDYSGTFASSGGNELIDNIDLENDLGYSDESHNIIWFALEHPVPIIPNIKIVSSDLEASSDSNLSREIEFSGQRFTTDVSSTFDLSNTEYTLYYEILDNWVNLDLGLTARVYDGEAKIASTEPEIEEVEEIDFTIPLLYAKARFDLPFTGFFVDAEVNIISFDGDSISDMALSIGYESDIGLGAKLGLRRFSLDVEDDDFVADIEMDGTYISAFYHF